MNDPVERLNIFQVVDSNDVQQKIPYLQATSPSIPSVRTIPNRLTKYLHDMPDYPRLR